MKASVFSRLVPVEEFRLLEKVVQSVDRDFTCVWICMRVRNCLRLDRAELYPTSDEVSDIPVRLLHLVAHHVEQNHAGEDFGGWDAFPQINDDSFDAENHTYLLVLSSSPGWQLRTSPAGWQLG